jgi:L-alanine-DL-glutamate epimerase-like enolase superfamily enzyme
VSRSLTVRRDVFPIAGRFVISRGARTEAHVLVAEIGEGGARGRGECVPYARYDESLDSVWRPDRDRPRGGRGRRRARRPLRAAPRRRRAQRRRLRALGSGGQAAGEPVWALAGLPRPGPVATAFTLSLDAPEAMRAKAAENAHRPLLKVKLGGEGDLAGCAPCARARRRRVIVVDANEGWTAADYAALAPEMVALGVAMVEQPLPAGEDAPLAGIDRPLTVCADESCHDRASLPALKAATTWSTSSSTRPAG